MFLGAVGTVALLMAARGVSIGAEGAKGLEIDAKDAELSLVLELLSGDSGPKLTAHPDVAKETVSFAAKGLARTAAVRWLCRTCGLAVVRDKAGKLIVGKPSLDESVVKTYRVGKLTLTAGDVEALVSFIKRVVFGAYKNVRPGEDETTPRLGVKWEEGQLKVLAPDMVQRETQALLLAMAKAEKDGDIVPMVVKYEVYDLGLFRSGTGAEPPPMKGNVSLKLDSRPATEAAWELTSKSATSFYVDPWDTALQKAPVTVEAANQSVAELASKIAKSIEAELIGYDGAWLLIREWRKPIYESLVVRVYNISAEGWGGAYREGIERRTREIKLPENLPYRSERVGDRFLISMPGPNHKDFEALLALRPRGPWRPPSKERNPRREERGER